MPSIRDRNNVDRGSNLLGRFPVSCPHDREECLHTEFFMVRLLPESFLKHGNHVVVYLCLLAFAKVFESPSTRTSAQSAENVHHSGQCSIVRSF